MLQAICRNLVLFNCFFQIHLIIWLRFDGPKEGLLSVITAQSLPADCLVGTIKTTKSEDNRLHDLQATLFLLTPDKRDTSLHGKSLAKKTR
jgi:hypothetical protein